MTPASTSGWMRRHHPSPGGGRRRLASLSRDPTTTLEPAAGWSAHRKSGDYCGSQAANGSRPDGSVP